MDPRDWLMILRMLGQSFSRAAVQLSSNNLSTKLSPVGL